MHARDNLSFHIDRLRDALTRYERHHATPRRDALLRHAETQARIVSRMLGPQYGEDPSAALPIRGGDDGATGRP